jgi:putative transposase
MFVHVVWSTQRRAALLPPEQDELLSRLLSRAAADLGCSVMAAGNASDHVHVVVRLRPAVGLAALAQRLKGVSCYRMNASGLLPARLGWQRGYYAEAVGVADLDPLVQYVRRQRTHHDDHHPAEVWQFPGEH